jgi:hypothetical protein
MTFLKRLGQVLAQGIAVAAGIWPLAGQFFGAKGQQVATTVINDLTQIGGIVTQVEAIIQTPGSGAVKLQAAVPLVVNIVKTSEMVSGHKIANETLFIEGCTDITSGVAKILNSLDAGAVQASGKPLKTDDKTDDQG